MKTANVHIEAVAPGVGQVFVYGPRQAAKAAGCQRHTCQLAGQIDVETAKTVARRATEKLQRRGWAVERTRSGFCSLW